CPVDAAAVAERVRHRLARRDAEILDGMMLIDVEVAGGLDLEIEPAVARHQLQDVIEKADTGVNPVSSPAVERQPHRDIGLGRAAADHGAAHSTSSITAMQRRVCSTMPAAMRMQPAQPGSADRSRMYTPRAKAPSTRRSVCAPAQTSTKFDRLLQYFSPRRSHALYSSSFDSAT